MEMHMNAVGETHFERMDFIRKAFRLVLVLERLQRAIDKAISAATLEVSSRMEVEHANSDVLDALEKMLESRAKCRKTLKFWLELGESDLNVHQSMRLELEKADPLLPIDLLNAAHADLNKLMSLALDENHFEVFREWFTRFRGELMASFDAYVHKQSEAVCDRTSTTRTTDED